MKRIAKPLDIKPGELDTYTDAKGREVWSDGGHPVSQGNAFDYSGRTSFNISKMAGNARSADAGTRRITRLAAQGVSIGTIPGMSSKSGGSVAPRHFDVFPADKPKPADRPENWATMNRKV